ncbi:MAG: CDP-diacylglycerol--serine O-phosphatidyltransferase [Deltaproteobacteria bacterium]|nr:CDP-diacylglycerol--serine O-phosphatidyltransferase [Deltaproteobacteria bacterium]
MKRVPLSKGVYILPSLFTTGSLFCGFYSIVHSVSGDFVRATIAIFAAGFFDLLDGRIARLTKSESDFGVEYDSLVDLVSFGLAPALLLYMWNLKDMGRIGWLAAFVYFACGALRLARYNIQIGTIEKKRFEGLPIPAAALTLVSFVIFFETGYGMPLLRQPLSLFFPFLLGPLMVSRIPYRSFKDLDFKRSRNAFYLLVGMVGVILVIASDPERVLFYIGLLYISSGPLEKLFLSWKAHREKAALTKGESLWRRRRRKITVLEESRDRNAG